MLARRMTIKEIAAELGISKSGVNKHVAALKRRFEVNALSEVVAAWRDSRGDHLDDRLSKSPRTHQRSDRIGRAEGSG